MTPYYTSPDGSIVLYLGDCLEVLPQLAPADHVITDPPYSEYVQGKVRRGGAEIARTGWTADYSRSVDLGFAALRSETRVACGVAFSQLVRRWTLVFSDVESASDWRAALTVAGLDYCRTGAWVKLGCTPQFTGDRPASGFEAVTIAHRPGRKRWNGGGRPAVWTHPIVLNRDRSAAPARVHTAQKPVGLMRELVALFTDPGETVLDPFLGSGTTARACLDLGRRCIGIEVHEPFLEVAAKRLSQQVMTFEATA